MSKATLFHAGRGMWEVRRKTKDGISGVGYFFSKKEAQKIIKKLK